MASNYTANYGLSQWEPGDSFLRAEFNRDNARVDGALTAVRGMAEQACGGLESIRYNVCNLLLRASYEHKNTGWKQGILFDGFLDGSGIAAKSEAVLLLSGGLRLSSLGQTDVTLGYGSAREQALTTRTVAVTGNGELTGVRYRIHSEMSVARGTEFTYAIRVNGAARDSGTAGSGTVPPGESAEFTLTPSVPIQVKPGDSIQVTLDVAGSAWSFHVSGAGTGLGGVLLFRPVSGQTGEVTTAAHRLPASSGLMAWVRHSGGAVGFSAVREGETPQPLALTGRRETTEPQNGAACTESAFALEGGTVEGPLAFRLDLDLEDGTEMTVFDYGVVLL